MRARTEETKFDGHDKQLVRAEWIRQAEKWGSVVDLWGNGEFYKLLKKLCDWVRIRTIDNGSQLKNKKQLIETFKTIPEAKLMNWCKYTKWAKKVDEKFAVVILDVCGPWATPLQNMIKESTKIMQNEGVLFITRRIGREHCMGEMTREKFDKMVHREEVIIGAREGFQFTPYWKHEYLSKPSYKGRSNKTVRMEVMGFTYKKIL